MTKIHCMNIARHLTRYMGFKMARRKCEGQEGTVKRMLSRNRY